MSMQPVTLYSFPCLYFHNISIPHYAVIRMNDAHDEAMLSFPSSVSLDGGLLRQRQVYIHLSDSRGLVFWYHLKEVWAYGHKGLIKGDMSGFSLPHSNLFSWMGRILSKLHKSHST